MAPPPVAVPTPCSVLLHGAFRRPELDSESTVV